MIKLTGAFKTPVLDKMNFPCGETHIKVTQLNGNPVDISWFYERDVELLELLFIADAVKRQGRDINELFIPYFPFARQDRVANEGEAFTLKVAADLINSIEAQKVTVYDPHSDVVAALVNNINVVPQDEIFYYTLTSTLGQQDFYLIACDAGAQKKIHKLAERLDNVLDVIDCSKIRDTKTGKITGVRVHADDLQSKLCIMVDDICDGGRTFIEVAKELKKKNAGKVVLMVTHGFFTKGFEVFDGLIDKIYTRFGKVYPETK